MGVLVSYCPKETFRFRSDPEAFGGIPLDPPPLVRPIHPRVLEYRAKLLHGHMPHARPDLRPDATPAEEPLQPWGAAYLDQLGSTAPVATTLTAPRRDLYRQSWDLLHGFLLLFAMVAMTP